jgi:membrane protease YdiL (CAAX protease family)
MRDRLKRMGIRLGLGTTNLLVVAGVLFGAALLIRKLTPAFLGADITAIVVFGAYLAGSRLIERRRPPEMEFRRGPGELAAGVAMGIGLFSVVMAGLWGCGVYHPARGSIARLGAGACIALATGFIEETLMRGFLFRLAEIVGGTWTGLIVSSALFGFAHAANPNATVFSSLAIALEAGILLGAAYALTGRLWLAIGIHAGWNFAEGPLFGTAVSGHAVHSGLLNGTLAGPVILTGGDFGPEASVVAIMVCLALAVPLLWLAVRRRRLQPPFWSPRYIETAPN